MTEIEKEREAILQQLNNLGRRLEQDSPADASRLNEQLRLVVQMLATLPSKPKGSK